MIKFESLGPESGIKLLRDYVEQREARLLDLDPPSVAAPLAFPAAAFLGAPGEDAAGCAEWHPRTHAIAGALLHAATRRHAAMQRVRLVMGSSDDNRSS